jgi:hypothetical protein
MSHSTAGLVDDASVLRVLAASNPPSATARRYRTTVIERRGAY